MHGMSLSGRLTVVLLSLVAALALATPAYPQSPGRIRGTVLDAGGQPVADAVVVVEFLGGETRRVETRTNDEGEYVQIGLMPGAYRVTAASEGVGMRVQDVTVRSRETASVNLELLSRETATLAAMSEEERERFEAAEAARGAFDQGVAATGAGNYDEAITKFTEAIQATPDCADCHHNLGIVYTRLRDYDRAESAFTKALELNPDDAAAYSGLAEIYNAQGEFDQAAEASAQAARLSGGGSESGSADRVFSQGIILWNAGQIAEARKQFEQTLEFEPNHGEAHYWLGMANLNEGRISEAAGELKLYLEREPNGRFAAEAKAILGQIQP